MKVALTTLASISALAASSPAAMILGNITFDGGAILDTDDFLTASRVVTWESVSVDLANGDFETSGLANGSPAIFADDWVFGNGQSAYWSAGGFTFNLDTSNVNFQTASFILVEGTGTITGNGFEPTPANLRFSTQSAGGVDKSFSFSAASAAQPVPEPGAAGLILLSAVGLVARRRR